MHLINARLNRVTGRLVTLAFILPVLASLLAVAPAQVLGAEPPQGGGVKISGGTTVHGTRTATPPQLSSEQRQQLDTALQNSNLPGPAIAEGAGAKHQTGAPAIPGQNAPPKQVSTAGPNDGAPLAAADFSVYQNNALPVTGEFRSTTDEPSVASHGNVVFMTANWYAAVSTDYGTTWSYLDPFAMFPSANGGFCCDQGIIYDPGRDVWVWELQYAKDVNGNTIRIATTDTAGVVSNTWTFYNINAQQMGQAAGVWIDYPNMALSSNYFYYTGNLFCNTCNSSSGGVAVRIALADLHARPIGGFNYQFYFGNFTMVPTQGATSTMYLAAHQSTTLMRIATWPEANALPTGTTDVAHTSYNPGAHNCVITASGLDPCARDDNRVKTAWVARGIIGVYWDVGQGAGGLGNFPYPYIQGMTIAQNTLSFAADFADWGSTIAFGFPGAGVNGRGAIGVNEFFAGGAYAPGSLVRISDDFNGFALPGDITYTRLGTDAPSAVNRWGDFLTARPDGGNGNTWIGVGFTLQGPCTGGGTACANVEVRYLHWGRERDNPFAGKQALPGIRRGVGLYLENSLPPSGPLSYAFGYGASTDQVLMCDWRGNGQKTPAIFRNGTFYISYGYTGTVDLVVPYGAPGDIGVCGDWNGTGMQKVGIFRNGLWALSFSNTSPAANIVTYFGSSGQVPVAGDWNGTGVQKIGVFQNGLWALSFSNTSPAGNIVTFFGSSGQAPVVGDWSRTGTEKIGIFQNGTWALSGSNTSPAVNTLFTFGGSGDVPVVWR